MLYQPADTSLIDLRGVSAGLAAGSRGSDAGAALLRAVGAMRRRKFLVLACIVGVPLMVGIALLRVTPRYTAIGSVLFEPKDYANTELQSILRADPVTEQVISSQAELIRSTGAAERLIDTFGLMDRPDYNPALAPPSLLARARATARGLLTTLGLAGDGRMTADDIRRSVVSRVQQAITVAPVRNSHVIEVSFTATDPALAARCVDALMDGYLADQLQSKFGAVRSANEWLQTQAQELQKTVSANERRIADYKARNGIIPGMVAGLSAEDVSHLSDQLIVAKTELATAEANLDAARGRGGAGAQAAVAPSVQPLRTAADTLNAQLRAQMTTYGANLPQVMRLREQVAQAYRAVDAEVSRVVAASDASARAARAKVAALQQTLATAQAQSGTQSAAQVPLDAMQREADASRNLLQSVLGAIQRLAQQTAIERPDASIVSRAAQPSTPSFPKTGLLLGAATLFGLCLGLLLTYLLEILDATLGASEDIRRMLGVPCLALVPHVAARQPGDPGRRPRTLGQQRQIADKAALTSRDAAGRDRDEGIDDYVVRKPRSHFAEQIRAVRAAFWFASHDARTVAITSARPNEGKTTTAIALGRSTALNGERVIVVDCDIRQPSLGEGPGLSNYLRGEVKLADVIHRDPLTPLEFMAVGTPAEGGGGPFMSESMSNVLAELKRRYDLVILDSPPVLAMTDARVIASLADTTLVCVRWRDTPQSVAGRSLTMLQDAQAHVSGAILTRIDARVLARSGLADAESYDARYAGYYRD